MQKTENTICRKYNKETFRKSVNEQKSVASNENKTIQNKINYYKSPKSDNKLDRLMPYNIWWENVWNDSMIFGVEV